MSWDWAHPEHPLCLYEPDVHAKWICACDQIGIKDGDVIKLVREKDGETQELWVAEGAEHVYVNDQYGWQRAPDEDQEGDAHLQTDLPIG